MTLNLSVCCWFKVQLYLQFFSAVLFVGKILSFQKETMCLGILGERFPRVEFATRFYNVAHSFLVEILLRLDFQQLGKCFVFGKLCFPHSRLSVWKPQRMGWSIVPSAPEHQLSGTLQRAVLNISCCTSTPVFISPMKWLTKMFENAVVFF